jgi:predicted enzyme related to lactoylglutathione lyase
MTIPEHAARMGARPTWTGYILVDNVDTATENVKKAGGAVHREPADIPAVGRFSVVADPQGATFVLFKPQGEGQPPAPPMTPGHVGWHELYAAEWKSAFDFYAGQFGWTKTDAMDMGEMGTYQLFATGAGAGADSIGGMFNKPADVPAPFWLFYFNVGDIDAAAQRVTGKWWQGADGADGGARRRLGPAGDRPARRDARAGGLARLMALVPGTVYFFAREGHRRLRVRARGKK